MSEKIGGIEKVKYIYDKRSNIAQVNDYFVNVTTKFSYDLIGRIIGISSTDGQKVNYNYDNFNRIKLLKWSLNNISLTSEYIYGDTAVSGQKTGLIYGVKTNGIEDLRYVYDELCRLKTRTLETTTPYVTEYTYLEGQGIGTTTTLIKTVKNGNDTLEYVYDELGNITSVKKNNVVIESYTYDSLNQLTSATYGGDTYAYTYDNGGNILSVTKNGETVKTYTYGDTNWKDLLTGYNGQTITYDTIGNPIQYRDGFNFTWANGRQLTTVTKGENSYSYTYNADSLRTSKTVNGVTTNYYWSNGILQAQKTGDEYIIFLYDESGRAYGFLLKNGTTEEKYYYIFNAQGDVIGIVDSNGSRVVEYYYDTWGNLSHTYGPEASTIGQLNPIRYRGYYYDSETGFYYLQTRYYDPEICRFINADGQISGVGGEILGYNMFAYCMNNPVNMSDSSGNWPFWAAVVVSAVIIIPTVINHIANAINKKKIDSEIKENYTKDEAIKDINAILNNYSSDCNITFDLPKSNNSYIAEIKESYKVTSRYDRQKISAIIENTNITSREYDNISSEWLLHNLATPIPSFYEQAHSVGIDYDSDPRWYVIFPTNILEFLGWE